MKYILENDFKLNNLSLQRILKQIKADVIEPENDMVIQSIDTVDACEKVMMQLCISKNINSK